MEGRGRCVQVLAEFQSIKHENNFSGRGVEGGKIAGVQRCGTASEAAVKWICKE